MNKKDIYIEKAQAKIDEYSAELARLKAKTKGEFAELKIEAQQQIDQLDDKLSVVKTRLSEIVDAAEDKWEDLSVRFEELSDDLGAAFRKFFEKHQ